MRRPRLRGRWAASLLLALSACALNPATGQRELSLVSESQEIEMGRASDPAAVAEFGGLYPDPELRDYVSSLGQSLARQSERPELPWSFRLVDYDLINAFALPGGFIYITRGILAHMNSEAELAGVLGHEIGHVTARHGARRITQQQLGMLAVIGGALVSERIRDNAGLALAGLQLLMLKHGREDERQADALGYRYMLRTGHDPAGISDVMRMLESTSPSAEEMGVPGWLLSHPNPGDRVADNEARLREAGADFSSMYLGRDEFLRRLDGLVFGEDPRQGYFIGGRFIQPTLGIETTFPGSWSHANSPNAVQAVNSSEDAALRLSITDARSPSEALNSFADQEGMGILQSRRQNLNGLDAAWADFSVNQQNGSIRGRVLFVAHDGRVYQLMGFATAAAWSANASELTRSLETFRRVSSPRYLDVAPNRISIVRLDRSMSAEEFLRRYPSNVSDEEVLLANQIRRGERLERGRLVKRITGGRQPRS